MARRTPPSIPERPVRSIEQKRRDIERISKRIKELEEFDPQTVAKRHSDPNVIPIQTAIDETLSTIFGHGTVEYRRYSAATRLDNGPIVMRTDMFGGRGQRDDTREAREHVTEGRQQAISLLKQAKRSLEEEIELEVPTSELTSSAVAASPPSRKVFVVHGHDNGARDALARFLEKIELEAIILHEQPDQGLTVIEKFESYASQVAFAVVLLTPDDLVASASASTHIARARQNVMFELGYFVGKLGRGRACLLRKGDVEIPSDLYGVIYTDMDIAEGWKMKLVQELKVAGLSFDVNKIWS